VIATSERDSYFITVTNVSVNREVEITHVWFDTPSRVHVWNSLRPLPKRLKADEIWSTWTPVESLSGIREELVYSSARVMTSGGKVFKSRFNKSIPEFGSIPGGVPPEAPTGNIASSSPATDNLAQEKGEQMLRIVDDLRRSAREHRGNCLTAEIGSELDRLYGRMVEKGILVRGPFGYTLPEFGGFGGRFD
jgi:hypothetical protein